MKESIKSIRIFSKDGWLPPMFGENFRESGTEWERISDIDFDLLGRILFCHLIIEHYIIKVIELSTPKEFDWNDARLSFSQKLKLISKIDRIGKELIKGIGIVNKIRNSFSHDLQAKIDHNLVKELQILMSPYTKNTKIPEIDIEENDIVIIEIFTVITLSGLASYCSSMVSTMNNPSPKSK